MSAILAVLLFGSVGACAKPTSNTPISYASEAAPADAFPLTVTRRGGFAGVDDSARITADGSAVVTHRGQPPVQISLPADSMEELRRQLATPARSTPPRAPSTCNDVFKYEIVTPSAKMVVDGCDTPHDGLVAIAAQLFNA